MKHLVQFINLEEDDKDIIVSFVIPDNEIDVKSLILHRTLFLEEILDEEQKGVIVSFEGEEFENPNTLEKFELINNEITIKTKNKKYNLDISKIEMKDKEDMLVLLTKQNYDSRFIVEIA